MSTFSGQVIVVTGAASGIGLAIARKALQAGMNTVMADIEQSALDTAVADLGADAANVMTQVCDVSDANAMDALAAAVIDRFGAVDVLVNNAGVGGGGLLWEMDASYWNWVLNINLNGVFHGVRSFVPHMIAKGSGHIVNTASVAGLMSAHSTGPYTVSKHGVVALSEVLSGDLNNAGHNIGVSVLCPSYVDTKIYDSQRHTPPGQALSAEDLEEQEVMQDMAKTVLGAGLSPDDVANQVFDAIKNKRFYILTHPDGSREQLKARMQAILDDTQPGNVGPEHFPM